MSTHGEAWYYLGHARLRTGDARGARLAWERAQQFGALRRAALVELAGLAARSGDRSAAIRMLQAGAAFDPSAPAAGATRMGGLLIALLRAEGRFAEAGRALADWRRLDPTGLLVRHERLLLGFLDPGLWAHLAADPERVLQLVEDYLYLGLEGDALALLRRDFERASPLHAEPGMPLPEDYPLLAYYEGWVLQRLGRDPSEAWARAAAAPLRYVFPNRHGTEEVLRAALAHDPDDANAHALLGALLLSGGRAAEAMAAWEQVRSLRPATPTLHRNMGWTVLASGGDPERARVLFAEGVRLDPLNDDVYFGLDSALVALGRSVAERAEALMGHPDPAGMSPKLAYHAARLLARVGRFDEAEELFRGRFFPSEEGGTDVRRVWLEVRLARAAALADEGACGDARGIVDTLTDPVPGLAFTETRTKWLLERAPLAERLAALRAACPPGFQGERP